MNRGPIYIVLAAMALLPIQAAAQSQWEQQVLDQIGTASGLFAPEGYAMVGDAHMGSLYDESSEDFQLTLQAGVHYVLLGVCDNDCPDIDLVLLDGAGNEIGSDYKEDAFPLVEVTPPRTVSYRVHVYMADCTSEPCFYGVGLFAEGSLSGAAAASPSTRSYQGRLDSGDDRLGDDYFDAYDFQGSAGDVVLVDLFSSDFDTYLVLLAPSGADTHNDDYEGSRSRSRIEKVLDEGGQWTVLVMAYQAGETGAYELSIATESSGRTAAIGKKGDSQR